MAATDTVARVAGQAAGRAGGGGICLPAMSADATDARLAAQYEAHPYPERDPYATKKSG